ncbi:MAG: MBL fold metallo-hydrolase RNA specificity domain-containing protein [Oscillospiraceae bacterium]
MKLTFIGAVHDVTGSCTLLEIGAHKILIDCGMRQGANAFENIELPVPASSVDCVLLTHAHIDHSGNLPLLYKNGFRGVIYATDATCSLCEIMLRDCAHIQMSDAEYKTRKARRAGEPDVEPVYDINDAEGVLRLFRRCEYAMPIRINENVTIRFTDIGHLLGSACIEVWLSEGEVHKKIVFSGDVGNTDQPIICDPMSVEEADYLMIESTYGSRNHGERHEYVHTLAGFIQRTLDRGGNVIIPSFAVGRTQEILYFIREIKNENLVTGHGNFPVYVDSPLANEATSVFMQCDTTYLDEETKAVMAQGINPLVFDGLYLNTTTEESKELNFDPTPKVIISASGMCEAGRIRHHLKYNLWRKECLILFVGYQAEGTTGRAIYDGAKSVKLFGDDVAVNAEIGFLPGVSGHADKQGLLNWLAGFTEKPRQIFVNHGSDESCTDFTRCLNEEKGYNAFAPYSGTEFDLASGQFIRITDGVRIKKETPARTRANAAFSRLMAAAERLMDTARSCEGMANKDLIKYAGLIDSLTEKIKK